jgi:hypothetical protein
VNDIETAAFEIAKDSLNIAKQLLKRYSNAQIGHHSVHSFGFYAPLRLLVTLIITVKPSSH